MIKKLRALMSREKAFTLVELLIVIAIIGILTLAFLPNILKAPAKARDAIRIKQISDIANAVEVYATEKGNPPEEITPCFGQTQSVLDALGIIAPKDDKKLGSCGVAGQEDKFYYRFTAAAGTEPAFYIVGAKLEAASGANTVATWTTGGTTTLGATCPAVGINGVNTIECARSLTTITAPAPGATEFWRIAVGPQ